jgi:hypothetical protein
VMQGFHAGKPAFAKVKQLFEIRTLLITSDDEGQKASKCRSICTRGQTRESVWPFAPSNFLKFYYHFQNGV